jgi:hypothetical protein
MFDTDGSRTSYEGCRLSKLATYRVSKFSNPRESMDWIPVQDKAQRRIHVNTGVPSRSIKQAITF